MTTNTSEYNEPEKIKARRRALSHAVRLLTKHRTSAVAVSREHVRRVKNFLLKKGDLHEQKLAQHCSDFGIGLWEDLWDSHVGVKRPQDLTVAYLAGPQPLNDFRVLVELGVHPYNIWAFESKPKVFDEALLNIKKSEFPLLKIQPFSIEHFFVSAPKRFDIIYIDACGPLPSPEKNTLRILATLFKYQRLNSPGVLITNFALPGMSDELQHEAYADLISAYLYPKTFLETDKKSWNLTEGPISHGLTPKEPGEPEQSFFHVVSKKFDHYYGQYITRQIFDLASCIAPWTRFIKTELWNNLFTIAPEEAAKKVVLLQHFDDDGEGGSIIIHPEHYPVGWTLAALFNGFAGKPDVNYPVPSSSSSKLHEKWLGHMAGLPTDHQAVRTAIESYNVLSFAATDEANQDWFAPSFREVLSQYAYMQKMHFFCDVPTNTLAFFPAIAQHAFPMHQNTSQVQRFSYVASGKTNRMFLDVIPFDECRYIYDWLPSVDLLGGSFDLLTQQLIYRFALDGLVKQLFHYNNEYLYGCNVVGTNHDGFEAKVLTPRLYIGGNKAALHP